MTTADDQASFSPPYNVPWATFLATVEKVVSDLPNRVDRGYLDNQSGTIQTYLISAFKGFGFIREDGGVEDALKEMADPDARKATMAALLQRFYPRAVELGSTNATDGELNEAFGEMFPKVNGESRTKAIRFYLFAAEYAGVPRSPIWKTAKAGSTPRRGRARKAGTANGGRGGTGGIPPAPDPKVITDPAALRARYFDLLLKKAEATEELDSELLDRIERLIGVLDEE